MKAGGPAAQIDERIREVFRDDGLVLRWHLSVEVESSSDQGRYLAHRSCDLNAETLTFWETIGLLESGLVSVRAQLERYTIDADDAEEESGGAG